MNKLLLKLWPGPLAIKVARRHGICRICRKPAEPSPQNPMRTDYGLEYAHTRCLAAEYLDKWQRQGGIIPDQTIPWRRVMRNAILGAIIGGTVGWFLAGWMIKMLS